MQFRGSLWLALLLSMSCNTKQPVEHSNSLESLGSVALPTDEKSELQKDVNRTDKGVEIIPVTDQQAEELGVIADPGFAKSCVLFYDIPGDPPYSFQQKRLVQQVPDHYYPSAGPSSENILGAKNRNRPTGFIVSARGFLPGEKITIRLNAKDAYREVSFCPRPLLLKTETGKILAQAALLSIGSG